MTSALRVVGLEGVGRDDVALAGGKGANLGELVRAGLPVPPGFVVTTQAYGDFLVAGGLGDRLADPRRRPRRCAPWSSTSRSRRRCAPRSWPRTPARLPAGGRAFVGDRGGPGRRELRRAAGHLPERAGGRRPGRRGTAVLGLAVERAGGRVPGAAAGRPRHPRDGRRGAGDGGGGRRGRAVHGQPGQRPAARGRGRPPRGGSASPWSAGRSTPTRSSSAGRTDRCCRGPRPTRRS